LSILDAVEIGRKVSKTVRGLKSLPGGVWKRLPLIRTRLFGRMAKLDINFAWEEDND